MADQPLLILQLARGGTLDRQLSAEPLASIASGDVLVEHGIADDQGNLEPSDAGEVVLSVPSPEAFEREAAEVRRVIGQAGTGTEPLVVVVEAAEELRDTDLAPMLEAAGHTSRAVIVRVIRDA